MKSRRRTLSRGVTAMLPHTIPVMPHSLYIFITMWKYIHMSNYWLKSAINQLFNKSYLWICLTG